MKFLVHILSFSFSTGPLCGRDTIAQVVEFQSLPDDDAHQLLKDVVRRNTSELGYLRDVNSFAFFFSATHHLIDKPNFGDDHPCGVSNTRNS